MFYFYFIMCALKKMKNRRFFSKFFITLQCQKWDGVFHYKNVFGR